MPEALDIPDGYTLRVTAINPSTGALVAGVNVGTMVITATSVTGSLDGGVVYGDWFLVPGPGA